MMKRLLFTLLLLLPTRAAAQDLANYDYENLTFRGIGFDVGYIWPSRVEPTSMYTLRLDLGFLGPALRLSPSISYWSSSLRPSELELLADRLEQLAPLRNDSVDLTAADFGEILWSDLGLALDAHIVWTAPLNIITFVGAGASVHALNGRGVSIDDTFVESLLDSTAAGIALMAGAEFQPLPRLRLYGEARYTVVSDVRYPALRIGAALMLPPRATAGTPGGSR
jgi:hypothetical protein